MYYGDFKGSAARVDQVDIAIMAHRLAVSEDHMQAVKEVEAASSGFDSQGRPKMLFEPHVFYRNLSGDKRTRAVDAGLAYRSWKRNYPTDSYGRLIAAMDIDVTAALRACSWGAGQILGENHVAAGYGTVEAMVWAFMEDEENHYESMVAFILANRLDDDLRRGDWRGFARGYNGSRYAENGYHTKLAAAYSKWQKVTDASARVFADPDNVGIPDGDQMREVQNRLRDLGYYEVGTVDGRWGYKSRAAVLAFRADNRMPLIAKVDDVFLAQLMKAAPRTSGVPRATATVSSLRDQGSETIARTDSAAAVGKLALGGGGVMGALDFVGSLDEKSGALAGLTEKVKPLLELVQDNMPLLLIAGGAFVVYQMVKAQRRRVDDHREGKHVGR